MNSVNLTMVKDEIFVLLGHNGAGKTTTINMMTGLMPKTAGGAKCFGKPIEDHLQTETAKVGICPQHSVLWDNLTCMEHLTLFASFKGVPMAEANVQAMELLREQSMLHKKDAR